MFTLSVKRGMGQPTEKPNLPPIQDFSSQTLSESDGMFLNVEHAVLYDGDTVTQIKADNPLLIRFLNFCVYSLDTNTLGFSQGYITENDVPRNAERRLEIVFSGEPRGKTDVSFGSYTFALVTENILYMRNDNQSYADDVTWFMMIPYYNSYYNTDLPTNILEYAGFYD